MLPCESVSEVSPGMVEPFGEGVTLLPPLLLLLLEAAPPDDEDDDEPPVAPPPPEDELLLDDDELLLDDDVLPLDELLPDELEPLLDEVPPPPVELELELGLLPLPPSLAPPHPASALRRSTESKTLGRVAMLRSPVTRTLPFFCRSRYQTGLARILFIAQCSSIVSPVLFRMLHGRDTVGGWLR
jgi:hypothetical protein